MIIQNKEQAQEAIAALCDWIHTKGIHEKSKPGYDHVYQAEIVEDVRNWCDSLLTNARADGAGGCLLCQS